MEFGKLFSNIGSGLAGSASKESSEVGGRVFSNKGRNVHPGINDGGGFMQGASNVLMGHKDARSANKSIREEAKQKIAKQGFDEKTSKRLGRSFDRQAAMSYAKNYAIGGDYAGQGAKRAGVVLARTGLATGAVVAPRYLSGGDMTTNRNGERDIAGIPFI